MCNKCQPFHVNGGYHPLCGFYSSFGELGLNLHFQYVLQVCVLEEEEEGAVTSYSPIPLSSAGAVEHPAAILNGCCRVIVLFL